MSKIDELRLGFETAYIDGSVVSNNIYRPQFVSNNHKEGKKVLSSIEDELLVCDGFQISVAFITMNGITPLLQTLKELEKRNIKGEILTTNYLNFSEPKALKKLNELSNITLKMYDVEVANEGFHTKGYIFRKEEIYHIIIGSSNITSAALTDNREWNTKLVSTVHGETAKEIVTEFNELWNSNYALTFDEFYENYNERYKIIKHQREVAKQEEITSIEKYKLQPNSMQIGFIINLKKILEAGEDRALLISATGTGKTYASAFAMRELGFKRVLFLVHRGQLARQTKKSYEKVFAESVSMGLVGAGYHEYDADYIFATVQTLNRDEHLLQYEKDAFDCIVLDEAHHVPADTYQKVMNHFTPKLWLGMTATPDKRDDNMELEELTNEQIAENISELCKNKNYHKIKDILIEINPTDVAAIFEELPTEQRLLLFRLLPKEEAAETFVELNGDTQEALITAFSDTELKEVIDELYLDDTVDIIEEMPATVVKRILKNTDTQTRKSINTLLKYPEDSAGSIMTPEFVDLKKDSTVEDAFKRIRRTGVDKETIYTCYVTDASRHLIGVTTVKELLLHNYDDKIEDFMETNIIFVNTHDDKEIAANYFDKYNFLALPVVDMEERLVGIITFDDAIDVLQEENTEDIHKMNAMVRTTEKPYLKIGIIDTFKSRIPWLLLLMIRATFTGMIITSFEEKLAAMIVLTAFIPMLMDTGGNSGGQASATIIRALSLNEIDLNDIFKVIWKEIRVGVACGLTLAIVNFFKILLIDKMLLGTKGITFKVDLVISLTLFIEIIFAKIVGCTLPIFAKKLKFDPAVMSSPFITTIVDALSLLIYFGLSTAILHI